MTHSRNRKAYNNKNSKHKKLSHTTETVFYALTQSAQNYFLMILVVILLLLTEKVTRYIPAAKLFFHNS